MNRINSMGFGKNRTAIIFFLVVNTLLLVNFLIAQQLAFPTAEGSGRYATGGRGGVVYEVTNLADSGPGSLRDAISRTGHRTIVFRVSGTITLKSRLNITNSYCTIAGQTAPGDGICLRDFNFTVKANDVIVRYIRVRMGDVDSTYDDDTFSGQNCKNVIIDHCSVSWSIDECFSAYSGIENWTIQWCFITESLRYSHHAKGAHGYGGICGGKNTSWHHNLLAHHSSRNPRWDRGLENVDEHNCVIYNWGFNSCYGGEANAIRTSTINMVANYYKAGPGTVSGAMKYRIANPTNEGYGYGQWHIDSNYVVGYDSATANNWKFGVQGVTDSIKSIIRAATPFPYTAINQQSPEEAYELVLQHGGASLPKRDTIDRRIIYEVRNGIALYGGKTGAHSGIIDSQNDVGGWPVLNSSPAPDDSDHDGMPNDWELAHSLNPSDSTDGNIARQDGYTQLEAYLNDLTGEIVTSVAQEGSLQLKEFTLCQNYPNPFNPTTAIIYQLPGVGTQYIVSLKVYDIYGREVAVLIDGVRTAGTHHVQFDGMGLSSGIYFAQLKSGTFLQTIKLVLAK